MCESQAGFSKRVICNVNALSNFALFIFYGHSSDKQFTQQSVDKLWTGPVDLHGFHAPMIS